MHLFFWYILSFKCIALEWENSFIILIQASTNCSLKRQGCFLWTPSICLLLHTEQWFYFSLSRGTVLQQFYEVLNVTCGPSNIMFTVKTEYSNFKLNKVINVCPLICCNVHSCHWKKNPKKPLGVNSVYSCKVIC